MVDTPGFYPGKDLEWRGMIRHGAQLVFAYARATVPRICLILRKSYGGAYIVMDSKTMGNDLCLAWPAAELAVMGAGQAAAILRRRATPEERAAFEADYAERLLNPYVAAERGLLDAVVEPAETRHDHRQALAVLAGQARAAAPTGPRQQRPSECRGLASARLAARFAAPSGRRVPWSRAAAARRTFRGWSGAPRVGIMCAAGEQAPSRFVRVTEGNNMPDTITIIDDRTGKQVTVPITDGVFPASAVRELDPSLFIYDPAYMQTAACKSAVTYLDGDAGILRYRGYPIEQLAENSTYLEVAYLLLNGELPNPEQLATWTTDVTHHTFIHENMRKRFVDGFHYDAHPMGMLVSAIAALGTFYDDAKEIKDKDSRDKQILRLIAKMPTLAAMSFRFSVGLPFVYPNNNLVVPGQLPQHDVAHRRRLRDRPAPRAGDGRAVHPPRRPRAELRHHGDARRRLRRVATRTPAPPPRRRRCTARCTAGPTRPSCGCSPRSAAIDNVPAFIDAVKGGQGGRLMGFGHRVYKNYDPRATIIKKTAYDVFEVTGKNPLLDIALKLEEAALSDDYFISRKLYPNVDFYSGLIYQALGLPGGDVHRAVRHPPHRRLAGPLAGAARRQGPEDQPPAPVVQRRRRARLHADQLDR